MRSVTGKLHTIVGREGNANHASPPLDNCSLRIARGRLSVKPASASLVLRGEDAALQGDGGGVECGPP